MNYYQQLKVEPDASAHQIKEAYRRLAFEYHPDRNTNDPQAAEKMKAINEAYAVLSDSEKRRQYDGLYARFGDDANSQFRASFSEQDIFRGSDIQYIFEEMARSFGLRGFEDIFKDFYGQGYRSFEFRQPGVFGKGFIFNSHPGVKAGASKNTDLLGGLARRMLNKVVGIYLPQRGSDIRDVIMLQPELASRGGPYAYHHRRLDKKLVVQIPAGVRDGQFIRLNGMGRPGSHGASAGDLLLKVRIKRSLMQKLKSLVGTAGASTKR
jgi:DnaJ-class molecular chaperone